jgi:hypothetical protein
MLGGRAECQWQIQGKQESRVQVKIGAVGDPRRAGFLPRVTLQKIGTEWFVTNIGYPR